MGNEESLVGFPVKQVVPALVSSLSLSGHCFYSHEQINVHNVGYFKADVKDVIQLPFCSFVEDLEDSKVSFQ